MVRRLLVLLSVLALALPTATLAKDPAHEPQRTGFSGTIDPQVLPFAMDDTREVTVMLEMRGDPVAVAQAEAGRDLSQGQKDAIKAELKGRQDAIKGRIAAEGGEVLSQLQSAYNGVKVRISRADVAALAALPNVVAVRALQQHTPGNATSVPYLGVPGGVWEDLGFTGEGVKVAVIDTGIDYTHANFGGPGTVAAFELADENDTELGDAGDAGIFGPDGSSKVKGGVDFVGDDYDASGEGDVTIPQPDPDPLDCNGHGSHVAGSAAGFGVLSDGTTYAGPYDSTTPSNDFNVGPGVAPEAELYALRVFGCLGSTDVTVDAIEWAVDNDMDVINMSLGSSFGRRDDPSAVASTNAAAAGVIVVTSSGNSGPSQYITGSPGTGTGAISTAAVDSNESFDGVVLDLSTGASITTISANGIVPPDGTEYNVVLLTDDPATTDEDESLGCSVEAFTKAGITDDSEDPPTLAVTRRNTCARVARAVFGQQAGADAVAMINNAAGLPPFEGPITGNPDTGESFEVTIPFLGVRGSDGATLRAADEGTATTTATLLPNPGFKGFASFSSGGPTNGDSFLKPDIAAPGVSIASTGVGTGNKAAVISGTSMASPHIAGVAALVRQAHPDWDVSDVKAAITNSGSPAGLPGYSVTRAGAGLVTPAAAVGTDVVALGDLIPADGSVGLAEFHNSNLSFGFEELGADYSETRTITVKNHGDTAVSLTPSAVASTQSRAATVSFGSATVDVPAGGSAELEVTLSVPASTAGNSAAFREVSGNVELNAEGIALRVPYLLVPRALSTIETTAHGQITPSGQTVTVTNAAGVIGGTADFYQLGLEDRDDVNEATLGGSGYDLEGAGVQTFPDGEGDAFLAFALSTHDRWSNAAVNEFDIVIDTTGDGGADFVLIGFDLGALTTGSFDGRYASFLLDLSNPSVLTPLFFAQAPHDSSSVLLFALASDFGLTPGNGDFTYAVQSFSLEGSGQDVMPGTAGFDAFKPALTEFAFEAVTPGTSVDVDLTFDAVAFGMQRPLGVMVVSQDDAAGDEAQLVHMTSRRRGP